jgi:predicted ABC-type transport system involved in lysophospholipase L1 biosynthesis ATPase subunit
VIRCEGLVKIYTVGSREVVALQGLELTVARGEMLAVVGPSGAGKSTLLNVLGGLDRPSAGAVWVGEQNLAALSEEARDRYRREGVGFIWQHLNYGIESCSDSCTLPFESASGGGRQSYRRSTSSGVPRCGGNWRNGTRVNTMNSCVS